MNIALVSGVVASLGVRPVGRRYAAFFSMAAFVVYALSVGVAAVVRAALKGCVAVWESAQERFQSETGY